MYLLFDIGGTQMRFAVSKDGKEISEVKKIPTIQNFQEALPVIRDTIFSLTNGEKIEAAVGGAPGPFDSTKSFLINAPHLTDWINKPMKETLEKILGCNVYLENDAGLAALGEATYGAGKDNSIVAFIGIGTGVGGAKIVDKKLDKTTIGFEPGHHIIKFEDGDVHYFEELVSGAGIKKLYGKTPSEINDPTIWEEIEKIIAFGLNNVAVFWSPEIIVLGGGIVLTNKISIEKIQFHLDSILRIYPTKPKIVRTKLDDMSGLYGALAYLETSPS